MNKACSMRRWEQEYMKVLVEIPDGKRLQRTYEPSLKNGVKMDLRPTESGGMDSINLV
jgi:hypothetical protein